MKRWLGILGISVVTLALIPAGAAGRQRDARPLGGDLTPAQIQRLFNAYELVQAEEMLDLADEQYPLFVARFNAVQDARRDATERRLRLLRELNQLSTQPGTSERLLEERLAQLGEHDRQAAAALDDAYRGVDEVLNVRQRVRFRIFEQQMQRRRVEMLQRARGRNGGAPSPRR